MNQKQSLNFFTYFLDFVISFFSLVPGPFLLVSQIVGFVFFFLQILYFLSLPKNRTSYRTMLLDFRWLERNFIAVNLVYTSRFSTILTEKNFQSPKKVRDFPIPPWDRFSVTHFSSTFSTSFLKKNLSISYELGLYCSLVNKSLVKRKDSR